MMIAHRASPTPRPEVVPCRRRVPRQPGGPTALFATLALVVGMCRADDADGVPPPQTAIARAARAVVKVYGSGGVRGLEGYQSGILVSPEGRILTAMSTVLDSADVECVLDDGTRHRATLLGADPRRELALLAINATGLPSLTLDSADVVPVGTRVIALSNLFAVAVGDERVSAQRGVVSAIVPLQARRGASEAPYAGDVYVLDCTTNNPGSAGGALVDSRGRLVGMLGKELRATTSGIWLSYALPAAELVRGVAAIESGTVATETVEDVRPFDPGRVGAILVPDLLDRTPPFVEAVVRGSTAERAGLRPDDLVIAVAGRSVGTRGALQHELGRLPVAEPMRLSVIRDGAIVEIDLGPKPRVEERPRREDER